MSYSSLFLIGNDYKVAKKIDYHNSWLLNPVVWDVMSEKYLGRDPDTGYIRHVIGFDGGKTWMRLNDQMNASENMYDRICWEFSNGAVFCSRDKNAVADALRTCTEINADFDERVFDAEHILERFKEVAKDIEEIDTNEIAMFIFKGTSVDDTVENMFRKYDEHEENVIETSLLTTEQVFEVVLMEDGEITEFQEGSEWRKQLEL